MKNKSLNLAQIRSTVCQDTVVLGKNVRHSFGRTRDRTPPPTLLLVNDHRRAKRKRIGNEEKGRPRTTTDARARSLERTRSQAFKRERKGLDSKDVD